MTMSAENVARAQEMREQGMYYQDIADTLGVSYGAIQYNLTPGAKERKGVYREANREKARRYSSEYHYANKETCNAASRAYHSAHIDESKASCRAYYAATRKERRAYNAAHLPEDAARSAARRAMKAGWLLGATAAQKAEIDEIYRKAKEEPNIRCYLCGEKVPLGSRHVDHVRALANGGAHRASNLGVTCASCNLEKGSKTLEEMGLLL